MAAEEKWYFTKEQLADTPSRRCGFDADRELSNRQQAANFIQDMGQRLQVTQLCINTAIVYMHRFYVYHSFTHFHRNAIATAALFLAAKVEEQPRKLEHVIKVAHVCLHREPVNLDPKSDNADVPKGTTSTVHFPTYIASIPLPENYLEQAQDLVFNENVLLQTLSFDVAIDHPHTHVVRCCHMVKASKDLAQTSYFMASNSLHLTTMCLQYKPTVVACFCIHLACKWSNWEIPQSNEGKDWFSYVDKTVTFDQLEQLTTEFLQIFDKCPTKLKRKIMSITATQNAILPASSAGGSQLFTNEPRKIPETQHSRHPLLPAPGSPLDGGSSRKAPPPPPPGPKVVPYDQYKEKKEKERLEREGKQGPPKEHRENHHSKPQSHPSKPHPSAPHPGREAKMAPPPSSSSSSALYYPSRPPTVTASRDQARREQAYAREMSKREMQHPHTPQQQQPSIFSPQPAAHTPTAVDGTTDTAPNHMLPGGAGASTKNSSQEWQEKSNHSNELDANRHHSDKYNNLVRDSNRMADPTLKRPHSKDHRMLQHQPSGEKLSLEESQRMYNSKYSQRKGENEAKEGERFEAAKRPHDQERHESLKRPAFGQSLGPPPKQRGGSDFSLSNHKKEEPSSRSVASLSSGNKQSGLVSSTSGHHASSVKPPPPVQHRVPPPQGAATAAVPGANHRVQPPPGSRGAPHTGHPQSRTAPPPPGRVPTPGVPPVGANRVVPPAVSQSRPTQPSGSSQHRGPTQFAPAAAASLQRPKSPRAQVVKTSDGAAPDVKPYITVHQNLPSIKLEARNGSIHPAEDVKRPPREAIFRPELIKTEPVEKRPVPEIGRGLADAFRSDSQKLDDPRGIADPVIVKVERVERVESDVLSVGTLPATPKSSVNSCRSAAGTLTPVGSSSRESSHTHRTPTKPSKHHTPPSANRKTLPELSLTPVGPMSPPDFGSSLLPLPTTPGKQQPSPLTPGSNASSRSQHRNRTTSSSSEPELIPYMKKIEEIAGYENVLDSKKGIKLLDKLPLPGRVPDIIQPIRDRIKEEVATSSTVRPVMNSVSKELKPPDLIRPFPVSQMPDSVLQANSSDLGAVAFPASDLELNGAVKVESAASLGIGMSNAMDPEYIKTIIEPSKLLNIVSSLSIEPSPTKSEHRHKSEKKKKKEKHKHKDKDKDKPKEERKKKHKHKDKDKHKDKELPHGSAPIIITIPKEKILSTTIDTNTPQSQGLKIKILKDRLKGSEMTSSNSMTAISSPVAGSGGLKLKISKDIIETYTTPMSTKESRKRERTLSKATAATTTPEEARPAKAARVDPKKPSPAAAVSAAPPSSYAKPNGIRSGLHGKVEPTGGNKGNSAGSKPSY